jgi:hypothetical protein
MHYIETGIPLFYNHGSLCRSSMELSLVLRSWPKICLLPLLDIQNYSEFFDYSSGRWWDRAKSSTKDEAESITALPIWFQYCCRWPSWESLDYSDKNGISLLIFQCISAFQRISRSFCSVSSTTYQALGPLTRQFLDRNVCCEWSSGRVRM